MLLNNQTPLGKNAQAFAQLFYKAQSQRETTREGKQSLDFQLSVYNSADIPKFYKLRGLIRGYRNRKQMLQLQRVRQAGMARQMERLAALEKERLANQELQRQQEQKRKEKIAVQSYFMELREEEKMQSLAVEYFRRLMIERKNQGTKNAVRDGYNKKKPK